MEIPKDILADDIMYTSKHALICKFINIGSSNMFINNWAQKRWDPNREFKIILIPNNYFVSEFILIGDKDKAFRGGPYNIG